MSDTRFPREERLKSRISIGLLFNRSSRSIADSGLRLVWRDASEPLPRGVQVLVAAPKKRFKKAVTRNRMKRLLREAWRLERGSLAEQWLLNGTPKYIGLIYTGEPDVTLEHLRTTLRGLLDRGSW